MNISKATRFIFFIGILFNGCLDPYAPPKVSGSSNYLVVSGFLNAGDGSCTITLSRSQLLSSTDAPTAVLGASVEIQSQDGNKTALLQQGTGVYSNSNISLSATQKYRLHITTNGSEYFSNYVPITQSPAIDSIGWSLVKQGVGDPNVNIYVNSHGTSEQSRYYLWNFQETWSYTAAYESDLKFENGQIVANLDTTYFCWQTLNSASILIASTTQLSQNSVHQFLLTSLPINSVKFSREYSILVNQMAVTEEAFEYWQQLKSNTENLGTIFGPQPSQFNGNLYSATNPSEPVFGYFMASMPSQKRIFIQSIQLPIPTTAVVTGYEGCTLDTLKISQLVYYAGGKVLVSSYGLGPAGYLTTTADCVDCRLKGGTNVKPSFWR